jgi:hypothetical protein
MAELHVFGDEYEWIVARDEEDAVGIWCEFNGTTRTEHHPSDIGLERLPGDSRLSIWCDRDTGKPGEIDGDNCDLVTLTCAEWVERLGRGYLGTTEQ